MSEDNCYNNKHKFILVEYLKLKFRFLGELNDGNIDFTNVCLIFLFLYLYFGCFYNYLLSMLLVTVPFKFQGSSLKNNNETIA